jgi:hypothetical protein
MGGGPIRRSFSHRKWTKVGFRKVRNLAHPGDARGEFATSTRIVGFSNRSPVECELLSVERNASAHGGRILTAETGARVPAIRAHWRPAYAENRLFAPLSHGNHVRSLVRCRNADFGGVDGGGRSPREPVSDAKFPACREFAGKIDQFCFRGTASLPGVPRKLGLEWINSLLHGAGNFLAPRRELEKARSHLQRVRPSSGPSANRRPPEPMRRPSASCGTVPVTGRDRGLTLRIAQSQPGSDPPLAAPKECAPPSRDGLGDSLLGLGSSG